MIEPTRAQERALGQLAREHAHVMAEHLAPRGALLLLVRCYAEDWCETHAFYVYSGGGTFERTPAQLAGRGLPATYDPTPEERGAA